MASFGQLGIQYRLLYVVCRYLPVTATEMCSYRVPAFMFIVAQNNLIVSSSHVNFDNFILKI